MQGDNVSTTGKEHGRKSSKPVMEKKRRARINASLAELKALLLDVIKNEGTRHSKMEKADILEMTVKHLRQIQRQHFSVSSSASSPSSSTHSRSSSPAIYQMGFQECTAEVHSFFQTVPGIDDDVRTHLMENLGVLLNRISPRRSEHPSPTSVYPSPAAPFTESSSFSNLTSSNISRNLSSVPDPTQQIVIAQPYPNLVAPLHIPPQPIFPMAPLSTAEKHDQPRVQPNIFSAPSSSPAETTETRGLQSSASMNVFGGLQVVPTKLPGGELLFIVPSNPVMPGQIPNYIIPVYTNPPQSMQASSLASKVSTTASTEPMTSTITLSPSVSTTLTETSVPQTFRITAGSSMPIGQSPAIGKTSGQASSDTKTHSRLRALPYCKKSPHFKSKSKTSEADKLFVSKSETISSAPKFDEAVTPTKYDVIRVEDDNLTCRVKSPQLCVTSTISPNMRTLQSLTSHGEGITDFHVSSMKRGTDDGSTLEPSTSQSISIVTLGAATSQPRPSVSIESRADSRNQVEIVSTTTTTTNSDQTSGSESRDCSANIWRPWSRDP